MENAERDYPKRTQYRGWQNPPTPTWMRRETRGAARATGYWLRMNEPSDPNGSAYRLEMAEYWEAQLRGYSHPPNVVADIRRIIDSYDPAYQDYLLSQ